MSFVKLKNSSGKEFSITGETLRLGRALDNDIVLNDKSISRYHLALQPLEDGIRVFNTGSDAGFYINNEWHLDSAAAKMGDVLRIGTQEFLVEVPLAQASSFEFVTPSSTKTTSLSINGRTKKIRLALVVVVCLMGAGLLLTPDENADLAQKPKGIVKPTTALPPESYRDGDVPQMGPQELTAADLYKRGMRDYDNQNYIRAMQWFQQSLVEDPSLTRARNALSDSEIKIKNQIEDLVLQSEKNFRDGRLNLCRSQANQALTLMSEQIPGFSFQVQQKQRTLATAKAPISSREEIYLKIACDQTPDEKTCERAVEVLKRSRVRLGEENTLK